MNIAPLARLLASGLPAIALILFAASAPAEDPFTGTWRITDAQTLNGRSYGGTVRIASIGAVYELQWDTSAGKYRGLGLADGDKLCTGWGGKNFGLVLYKINGDGTLQGRWTVRGANESEGTEHATGGTPGQLEGEYSVTGTNLDGRGGYEGKLRISQTGDTYQLRWTIPGNRTYYGVGLKMGDSLHVGWGTGSNSYAVISYVFTGGVAEGVWTIGGSRRTAKENLARK